MTASTEAFVGIDVSKDHLDVHRLPDGTARRFDNTPQGLAALVAWLGSEIPALIALEATGGYERPAVAALSLGGFSVAVVNPKRVRDFAQALGRRAKTDALDAGVLAQFAQRVRPPVRPLAGAEARELQALVARRNQLIEMRTMESNRLATANRAVRRSIEAILKALDKEIEKADGELSAAIENSAVWKAKDELLSRSPVSAR